MFHNSITGIRIYEGEFHKIFNNTITNNTYGIDVYWDSNNHIISNNRIENNSDIGIALHYASNNIVTQNDIIHNEIGIDIFKQFTCRRIDLVFWIAAFLYPLADGIVAEFILILKFCQKTRLEKVIFLCQN